MTQIGYPLAGTQAKTPQDWSAMAQNWLGTGVIKGKLNELSVYADSTGMQCKVKTGQAWLQGHFFQSDAEEILPIANADSSNPRIDRVIVRLDYTSDSIQLAVLQGVPAVSPVAPALTQNNTRWEISLAQVYVGANVSTIATTNLTDERTYSQLPTINSQSFGDRIEHGMVTINTVANANTSINLTFAKTFANSPQFVATVSNSAQADVFGRIVTGVSNTGASITIYASLATAVNVSWIAIGQ